MSDLEEELIRQRDALLVVAQRFMSIDSVEDEAIVPKELVHRANEAIEAVPLPDRARAVIASARKDLGHNLQGGSLTDLLLDNLPLNGVNEARVLLKEIGEEA